MYHLEFLKFASCMNTILKDTNRHLYMMDGIFVIVFNICIIIFPSNVNIAFDLTSNSYIMLAL